MRNAAEKRTSLTLKEFEKQKFYQLIYILARLRIINKRLEFYHFLRELPHEIGREELELYLICLKAGPTGNESSEKPIKHFSSYRDILRYLNPNEYVCYRKNNTTTEVPEDKKLRYIHTLDPKNFIAKGNKGLINKLVNAGLLIDDGKAKKRKKRPVHACTNIRFRHSLYLYQAHFSLHRGVNALDISWDQSDIIYHLNNYLYKKEDKNLQELLDDEISRILNSFNKNSITASYGNILDEIEELFLALGLPDTEQFHLIVNTSKKELNSAMKELLEYAENNGGLKDEKRKTNGKNSPKRER
jgi:hypothetical protein